VSRGKALCRDRANSQVVWNSVVGDLAASSLRDTGDIRKVQKESPGPEGGGDNGNLGAVENQRLEVLGKSGNRERKDQLMGEGPVGM